MGTVKSEPLRVDPKVGFNGWQVGDLAWGLGVCCLDMTFNSAVILALGQLLPTSCLSVFICKMDIVRVMALVITVRVK